LKIQPGGIEMKIQAFLVSLASILLMAPAWAQQSNGSSMASQTSIAAQGASDRQPLRAPTPANFWDGDDPNIVNLVTHPFANKAYVQGQTRPIRDRLNELDELTSENSRMIKDADSRAQRGIQMASEKSRVVDQHATDAMNRAQLAKTAAMEASNGVSVAEMRVASLDLYNSGAQTEIRFRAGQSLLNKNAKSALDTMMTPLAAQKGYIVEIHGFAPGRGRAATANAKKMSDSVVRYLVLTRKIPMYRISVLNTGTGKGTRTKHASSGRVEISVLHNGTVSTAQR
jgi:hypothetical protein